MDRNDINIWRVLAVCMLLGAIACMSPGAPPPPDVPPGEHEPYVIGVTDDLRISVWKNPELSVGVQVRRDGKISVPLLDDVQAEGLTPEELKEVITGRLSEYITAPDVTVIIVQMNSNSASIMGGVRSSGIVPLRKRTRVLEAIAGAGGFSSWAKRDQVKVLRPVEDGIVEYRFNYGAYVSGKARESNIVLKPGDTIVVPD